jgi:uncharacterized protein (DUF58 family)
LALRSRIREAVARWAGKRQGLDALPLILASRRIYILPTRAGFGFGALALVMLLAGLNYANSLALLLTFLLVATMLVGMHDCHATLRSLRVLEVRTSECFAGASAALQLQLENDAPVPRLALQLECGGELAPAFALAPASQLAVHCHFTPQRRGRERLPRLQLATSAPLGLFRAWTWLYLQTEVIVYPQPAGTRALPHGAAQRVGVEQSGSSGEEEWSGLRPYQPADGLKRVAWKLVARGGPFLVAQYQGASGPSRTLDFDALGDLNTEARLSQLAAWVLECDQSGAPYALRLPGLEIPLGAGATQRRASLEALALFGIGAT